MARGNAYIKVECDNCEDEIEMELTPLAHRGAWDERNIDKRLNKYGWIKDGDKDICDECMLTRNEHNA